jgi:hypothetical protein
VVLGVAVELILIPLTLLLVPQGGLLGLFVRDADSMEFTKIIKMRINAVPHWRTPTPTLFFGGEGTFIVASLSASGNKKKEEYF